MDYKTSLTKNQKIVAGIFASIVFCMILLEFFNLLNSYRVSAKYILTISIQLFLPFAIFYYIAKPSYRNNLAYAFVIMFITPVLFFFLGRPEYDISKTNAALLTILNIFIPCAVLFFVFRKTKQEEEVDIFKFLFLYAVHSRNPRLDIQALKDEIHPKKTLGYVYGFIDGITIANYKKCLENNKPTSKEFIRCLYSDFEFLYQVHPEQLANNLIQLCIDKRNTKICSATLLLLAALSHKNKSAELSLALIREAMGSDKI